jgi:hypothetical protein
MNCQTVVAVMPRHCQQLPRHCHRNGPKNWATATSCHETARGACHLATLEVASGGSKGLAVLRKSDSPARRDTPVARGRTPNMTVMQSSTGRAPDLQMRVMGQRLAGVRFSAWLARQTASGGDRCSRRGPSRDPVRAQVQESYARDGNDQ